MTTYSVGDSIARGIGNSGAVDRTFSRPNIPVGAEMAGYFKQATAEALAGDTVIVSGGYNGGDVSQMVDWIKPLIQKGVKVRILGLREEGLTGAGAPYAHLDGKTPRINDELREVARESAAVFSEKSILVANTIPGHEIHGNFNQLADAALDADPGNVLTNVSLRTPKKGPDYALRKPAQPHFEEAVYHVPQRENKPVPEYFSKEQLPQMSRDQVGEIQSLLREINLETGTNRYDIGTFGKKHDGVDKALGDFTSHAIQDYERVHHIDPKNAEELIADLKKTTQMHSEPAELPSSPSNVLLAKNDTASSKVRV